MKKWNAPEIAELNIHETAGGWSNSGHEEEWMNDPDHADGVHGGNKPSKPNKPVTPDTTS